MKRTFAILLVICLLLAGCGAALETTEPTCETLQLSADGEYIMPVKTATENTTNDRVFYQIFVGSFSDSNDDGIGDLRGIINRFDYLNDGDDQSGLSLGVEGIWLTPIFKSPSYHKYDVADYYQIDPQFGTMEDLKELIDLCHSRNVQLILDLPINHTSQNNLWFIQFSSAHRDGITDNEYYNYYTYADVPPAGRRFSSITGTKEYYECNFSGDMPELDFDNEQVRREVVDIAKFYLDMGVDGFRFDAAKYIYYGEEPRNAEFWIWYMGKLREIKPDIYTVAEVWDSDSLTYPYFASTNCFNFTMSQTSGQIAMAAKGGKVATFVNYVDGYLKSIKAQREDASMCTFIANHDMDRAAGFLQASQGQMQVAANLSVLLPGSTFIYYGEEIGMKGSRGGASTDANRRLAMLWGDGDTVKNPVGTTYNSTQSNGTFADQKGQPDSLYNHYKKLIAIRKAYPQIAQGEYAPLKVNHSHVGGFTCTLDGSTVAVLHNTTTEAVQIDISGMELTELLEYVGVGCATLEGTTLTIEAQTSVVLR